MVDAPAIEGAPPPRVPRRISPMRPVPAAPSHAMNDVHTARGDRKKPPPLARRAQDQPAPFLWAAVRSLPQTPPVRIDPRQSPGEVLRPRRPESSRDCAGSGTVHTHGGGKATPEL